MGPGGWADVTVTRAEFEHLCMHTFRKAMAIVGRVLDGADKKAPGRVGTVLIVGGSSNIPWFGLALEARFPAATLVEIEDKDEAIVRGAAIQAQALTSELATKQILVHDCTSRSLGIRNAKDEMNVLIKKNTLIPH